MKNRFIIQYAGARVHAPKIVNKRIEILEEIKKSLRINKISFEE